MGETALQTSCGTCGNVIEFQVAMLGKSSKCPQCGELVRLSDPNANANVTTSPGDKPATSAPVAPTTKDKVLGCGCGLVLLLLVSSCANYFWPTVEDLPVKVAEVEKPEEPRLSADLPIIERQRTSEQELLAFAELTDQFYWKVVRLQKENRTLPLDQFAAKVHQLRREIKAARVDDFHPMDARIYVGSPMGYVAQMLELCWDDREQKFAEFDYYTKTIFNERDVFLKRPLQFPDYPTVATGIDQK